MTKLKKKAHTKIIGDALVYLFTDYFNNYINRTDILFKTPSASIY
jgi:hypothetical protein